MAHVTLYVNVHKCAARIYPGIGCNKTSKTGPRWGPGRPALMASRLETTRSLECQPLPPPRSQQWLLKGEARS